MVQITSAVPTTEIVKIQSPQLHILGINEPTGTPEGYQLFLAQITSVVKFFGAAWDKDMLREAARLAYQENNFMTVAEVKLFIIRIKTGKYPNNKNFSPATFMESLTSFNNEIHATRGAVNAYGWRYNETPDEILFPTHDKEGKEIKYVTPEQIRESLVVLTKQIKDIEARQREEEARIRKERKEALQRHLDQQIISLVEHEGSQGIAPDKYLMQAYFKAIRSMEQK